MLLVSWERGLRTRRLKMVPVPFTIHWIFRVAVLSLFSSLLLMVYVGHQRLLGPDAISQMNEERVQLLKELRNIRLMTLRENIFRNPKRPADRTYNINVTLSERTSLDRELPDVRPKRCRDVTYDPSTLPNMTVIIPFYNEALSMLLRTVHALLRRTPTQLLVEIILVNDHSPNDDLGAPLENYVRLLPDRVKLVRTRQREGLIRARLIGARMARGAVLMFQDAHVENNVGWAEPLLAEIARDRSVVIQPNVDQVDAMTLEYKGSGGIVPRGGFSWDLRYTWMQMPDHERNRLASDSEPFRTPTLVGCALAVDRDYFRHIGGFDDAMNIWGGENIELAFRNWMCGGQVLTHPCSRVAHVFKPFSYKFDGDREKIVQKNLMRIAELWMDDWKKFFYAATYSWEFKRTHFTDDDLRSLEKRRQLKRKLECKGFDWYMKNITPEIPTPPSNAWFYGEVANEKSEACWYKAEDDYVALTYFCFFHRILPENIFWVDEIQRLRYRDDCVRVDKINLMLFVKPCTKEAADEVWDMEHTAAVTGMIRVRYTDHDGIRVTMCVLQVTNVVKIHKDDQMPQLVQCDATKAFAKWRWTYKFNFNYTFDRPL